MRGSTSVNLPESSAVTNIIPDEALQSAVSHTGPSTLLTRVHALLTESDSPPYFILISLSCTVPLVKDNERTFSSYHFNEVTYPIFRELPPGL